MSRYIEMQKIDKLANAQVKFSLGYEPWTDFRVKVNAFSGYWCRRSNRWQRKLMLVHLHWSTVVFWHKHWQRLWRWDVQWYSAIESQVFAAAAACHPKFKLRWVSDNRKEFVKEAFLFECKANAIAAESATTEPANSTSASAQFVTKMISSTLMSQKTASLLQWTRWQWNVCVSWKNHVMNHWKSCTNFQLWSTFFENLMQLFHHLLRWRDYNYSHPAHWSAHRAETSWQRNVSNSCCCWRLTMLCDIICDCTVNLPF